MVARPGHRFVGGLAAALSALLEQLSHRGAAGGHWHHRRGRPAPLAGRGRTRFLEDPAEGHGSHR